MFANCHVIMQTCFPNDYGYKRKYNSIYINFHNPFNNLISRHLTISSVNSNRRIDIKITKSWKHKSKYACLHVGM